MDDDGHLGGADGNDIAGFKDGVQDALAVDLGAVAGLQVTQDEIFTRAFDDAMKSAGHDFGEDEFIALMAADGERLGSEGDLALARARFDFEEGVFHVDQNPIGLPGRHSSEVHRNRYATHVSYLLPLAQTQGRKAKWNPKRQ